MIKMGKIYYVADMHLGHENIIRLCNRPFKNADEMDEVLINNYNSIVTDEDDVYFIGDFSFKGKDPVFYLKKLKGKKHLIVGNHDGAVMKNPAARKMFASIDYYKEILDEKRQVILFHYPIAEWNGYFRNSYHIYGHIHNNDKNEVWKYINGLKNCFNAGVDLTNFMPRTLDDFIKNSKN